MKDIPVFTTQNGAASLRLREIPYRQEAYIQIQSSQTPLELLEECKGFCRACGAERIYASGHDCLDAFPLHTRILEYRGIPALDEEKLAHIFPVTEETVGRWRGICNDRMQRVDNAATLESRDEARILSTGGAYFIHNAGDVLGIGWLNEGKLEAIAAVKPGAGTVVAHTLLSVCPGEPISLEVASTNLPAIRLYEALGLLPVREISRWYRI